jgi:CheY-like chemotaxis protein
MVNILVVDDELDMRELLRKALVAKGYEVTTIPSARQALEAVFREPFDLVLLDIVLGDGSGISVLKKIRETNKELPVVIYSGSVTPEIEKEAKASLATDVLRKDVGILQLTERIAKIVNLKGRLPQDLLKKEETVILIVDDEEGIRSMLTGFFKLKGYKTQEAENGQKALELVRAGNISSVLLDINMPVMDGLTALPKLLEINPKLGIVMVTAEEEDEGVKKALALGAYSYILKPFDFVYLELVVISRLAIAQNN